MGAAATTMVRFGAHRPATTSSFVTQRARSFAAARSQRDRSRLRLSPTRSPARSPTWTTAKSPFSPSTRATAGAGTGCEPRSSRAPEPLVLLARSLSGVDETLGRLLRIELFVTAAVLVCLAALALMVVQLGLRPLTTIGDTAAAIAAGDLSRRVARAEPRTEVGRLGLALNAMLGRIESAFNAQAASERRLRRFVADASHELRTPLAAVRAYAELFSRGADRRPEDLERSMRGITRESERMTLLVEDLLLLARLDEGRPLEREPLQLEEVVEEAVETARTVDPGRPITVSVEPTPVVGDRTRLRQVVDNLLSNVRAHTPAGAPVDVRVSRSNGQCPRLGRRQRSRPR